LRLHARIREAAKDMAIPISTWLRYCAVAELKRNAKEKRKEAAA